MKVALVYDRVNKWGGAERVLLALHEMYPKAPLFTSVYDAKKAPWARVFSKVETSFLQKFPFAKGNHELLGTFTPIAFEAFIFDEFDLVISVTSEAAKGILTKPGTKHICYMLTPTRYLWSHYDSYFKNTFFRMVAWPAIKHLRNWDKIAAFRPDKIISISREVKKRVKKYYGRDSVVVHPPMDKLTSKTYKTVNREYYLIVSRLVKYKRVDLAIEAFNKMGDKLIVVGEGHKKGFLKRISKKNIEFTGNVSDERLAGLYASAKALVFPQEEDFGIVALEAMSFGTPVIAFKKGGALDTVNANTGVFFDEQTPESLIGAIEKLEKTRFVSDKIIKHAKAFNKKAFKEKFREEIRKLF